MPSHSRALRNDIVHAALVVSGFTLLFTWLLALPIIQDAFLAESDLFEYYLPIFLAPITTWSSFEFSGLPAFADPGDSSLYPLHFLFARIVHSWTGFAISALVLAAAFTYAYVYRITGSGRAAAFSGLAYGMSEAIVERIPHLATLHVLVWLPLIVLAIENLRGPHRWRWVAVGGLAVGCCFLAGHPQLTIYSYVVAGLYGLVGGRAEGADRRYYVSLVCLFLVGGLLAAVKALPLAEASSEMARQSVNFGQFTGHSNSPAQMLSVVFSSIAHEGREAPTYIGLSTLILGLLGTSLARRQWRPAFWTCIAVVALLLGSGASTPLARVLYETLPFYSKFRVVARHLFLFAFAGAVLAGLGLSAIEHATIDRRRVRFAVALTLALIGGGVLLLWLQPGAFTFEYLRPRKWSLPVWSEGVWVQLAVVIVSAMAVSRLVPGRRSWLAAAPLLLLLAGDLLYALPYPVTRAGIETPMITRRTTEPSVHAVQLGRQLEPLHQRALAIGGTHIDAVVPAVFARLWQIPIAGGYGPMLLARTNALALMGTNGSVSPETLATDNVALDLLAVRSIIVGPQDLPPPVTFEREGLPWAQTLLELPVGRPDCNFNYARATSVALPTDMVVASIAVVSHLRCSEQLAAGAEVASIRVVGADGTTHHTAVRAGYETAELRLSEDDYRQRAKHGPGHVFDDPEPGLRSFMRIDLPTPVRGGRIELRAPSTGGWFEIDRLTLVDAAGLGHPQSAPELWLRDDHRWRETERFMTSRTSDRGADRPEPGERTFVVMENLNALPRAWVVPEVLALDGEDMREAIQRSQLPDGRPFNPRQSALVDRSERPDTMSFGIGASSASVTKIVDGSISVDVSSAKGGFLVLSEVYYPGWRARIDGTVTPVIPTDIALQGVPIPPGEHTVVFEFVPSSLRLGAALSLVGMLTIAGLLLVRLH